MSKKSILYNHHLNEDNLKIIFLIKESRETST